LEKASLRALTGDDDLDALTWDRVTNEDNSTINASDEMSPVCNRLDVEDEAVTNTHHEFWPVPSCVNSRATVASWISAEGSPLRTAPAATETGLSAMSALEDSW
jgi:hypothetical protein